MKIPLAYAGLFYHIVQGTLTNSVIYDCPPQGASFDAASGIFAWRPDGAQAGVYSVYFHAVDDGVPSLTSELGGGRHGGTGASPIELIRMLIAELHARNLAEPVVNSYLANLKKLEICWGSYRVDPAGTGKLRTSPAHSCTR